MYLASLINKGKAAYERGTTDPTALPADTLLQMATINGAKTVLWADEIGSLEVGKKVSTCNQAPFTWLIKWQYNLLWNYLRLLQYVNTTFFETFYILSSQLEIPMLYRFNREVMGLSLQFWCTKVKEFEPLHVPKMVEPKICLSRLVPTLCELKSSPMTTSSSLGLNLKIHPKWGAKAPPL